MFNKAIKSTKDFFTNIYLKTFFRCKKIKSISNVEGDCPNAFLAITAIIKNEAPYLKEWLEYHMLIGVEHFFLYDNESTDQTYEILKSYIDSGLVTYIECPGKQMQMPAYNDAIARFGENVHWMAFIDIDEFIFLNTNTSLNQFMQKFEKYSALGINWVLFDSNNYDKKPSSGFVISNYTRTQIPLGNIHLKTILKPKCAKFCSNPHYMFLRKGFEVNEKCQKIKPPLSKKISIEDIQLNHYFPKSKEEYLYKVSRGRADIATKYTIRKEAYDFSNYKTIDSSKKIQKLTQELHKRIPDTYGENFILSAKKQQ